MPICNFPKLLEQAQKRVLVKKLGMLLDYRSKNKSKLAAKTQKHEPKW